MESEPKLSANQEETNEMPRPSKEKVLAAAGHHALPMGEAHEPPPVVKKDKVALAAWHAAVAQLQKQGHFQTCDLMVIERYACTFSLTRKYEQLCQESTGIQETQNRLPFIGRRTFLFHEIQC